MYQYINRANQVASREDNKDLICTSLRSSNRKKKANNINRSIQPSARILQHVL